MVEVFFWLDLWEIFFLATQGFEPGNLWISSPALYHCTMAPSGFHLYQFQALKSEAEGLVEVFFWLDLWQIFFLATPGLELGTSGYLVLHSTTVLWWLLVFTSDNFRYWTLVQRDWWWYCFDWTCERFSFWPHQGFDPGTSGSLVLHSATVPQWLLVFTSNNFKYLSPVQRDWWWYCADWFCERFSFWPHQGLNWWPLDL